MSYTKGDEVVVYIECACKRMHWLRAVVTDKQQFGAAHGFVYSLHRRLLPDCVRNNREFRSERRWITAGGIRPVDTITVLGELAR